jgi:hypothetical protein
LARNASLLSKNSEAAAAAAASSTSTSSMSGGLSDVPYSQDRGFYPHAKIALGEIMGPVPLRSISETDRFVAEQRGGTENDSPTSASEFHAVPDSSNTHENDNSNENENRNGSENENDSIRTAGQEAIEMPLNATTSSSSSSMPHTTHSSNTGIKENNESDGVHQNNLSNQDDENENENENKNGDGVDNEAGRVTQLNDTDMAEINIVDVTNVAQTRDSDGMGSGSSAQHQEQEHQHEQQQEQSDSQSNNDNIITSERAKRKLGDTDFVNSSNNNNDNNMCCSSSNPQINREAIVDDKSVCAIRLNGSLIDTEFTKINNIVPSTSTYQ